MAGHTSLQQLNSWGREHQDECIQFLLDIINIPSATTVGEDEEAVAQRTLDEMETLNYDNAYIDKCGNVHGVIEGEQEGAIMLNAHMDTVGVGDPDEWEFDPYGEIDGNTLHGRGASDMKSALAAMVYAGGALADQDITPVYDLYVCGVVNEESLGWPGTRYAIEEGIEPDVKAVIIGEASEMNIKRGHRGRVGIELQLEGRSCHASAPERGINPLYQLAPIIDRIEDLQEETADHPFLGEGTIAPTNCRVDTPSNAAVPDSVRLNIDRRLTLGESEETAHEELEDAVSKAVERYGDRVQYEISTVRAAASTYTGHEIDIPKYSAPWVLEEDHPLVKTCHDVATSMLNRDIDITKWTFCTDGSYSMGTADIPTIGFGPMEEKFAHTQQDQVKIDDVIDAIGVYAGFATTAE